MQTFTIPQDEIRPHTFTIGAEFPDPFPSDGRGLMGRAFDGGDVSIIILMPVGEPGWFDLLSHTSTPEGPKDATTTQNLSRFEVLAHLRELCEPGEERDWWKCERRVNPAQNAPAPSEAQ